MQQRKQGEQLRIRTDLKHDVLDQNNAYNPELHPLNCMRTPSFEGGVFMASPGYIYQTPTNQHSPPINEVRAMRIFDSHSPNDHKIISSAVTAPKVRIAFGVLEDGNKESKENGHQRRKSAPAGAITSDNRGTGACGDHHRSEQARKPRKRIANINPFTPTPTLESIKRRKKSGGSSM